MMFKKLYESPSRLISLVGIVYLAASIILNCFTPFSYKGSVYPHAGLVLVLTEAAAVVLFIFTFIFQSHRLPLYVAMELIIFSDLYAGSLYTSLFISSILLVLFLTQGRMVSNLDIFLYALLEIAKLGLVIPYGVTEFFHYAALLLFALCTIGCINLLFRHAYADKNGSGVNLDELRLSHRQKECIREIVLNNTTIKALAIQENVSESAIKKDLAHIYKVLGITGKADLKALFIDYPF